MHCRRDWVGYRLSPLKYICIRLLRKAFADFNRNNCLPLCVTDSWFDFTKYGSPPDAAQIWDYFYILLLSQTEVNECYMTVIGTPVFMGLISEAKSKIISLFLEPIESYATVNNLGVHQHTWDIAGSGSVHNGWKEKISPPPPWPLNADYSKNNTGKNIKTGFVFSTQPAIFI